MRPILSKLSKKTQYIVNADVSQYRYLGFNTAFLFEGDTDTGMNFLLDADREILPIMGRKLRILIGDVERITDCGGYPYKAKLIGVIKLL